MLFDGDVAGAAHGDDMAARGKWPPFPWNPANLDNPLIGRDEALSELIAAFEDVLSDWVVRVQLLVSEYGLGKERLTAAFVRMALEREPNSLVVRVRCPNSGGRYRLLDTILREAFNIPKAAEPEEAGALLTKAVETFCPKDAEETARLIGYLVGYEVGGHAALSSGADEEAMVARAIGALGRFLEAVAHERPLLVVVGHANRATARDFALASALEATVAGRPIMMVFAGSPELTDHLPGWDRFPVIRLRNLNDAECERMLKLFLTGLDAPLPRSLFERILVTAGGNPYALKSMVRYLVESGGIEHKLRRYRVNTRVLSKIEIPDNLEGVLLARVGKLPSGDRQILAQAAVVGRDFWLGALVAIARQGKPVPEDLDRVEEPHAVRLVLRRFVEQRFIEARESDIPGEEAFSFRSETHWRVAVGIVPATMAQRYHRVIGSWLLLQTEGEEGRFLNEMARHAEGAGHPGDAAVFYLRAARFALREHQSGVALRQLEAAYRNVQSGQSATRMAVLLALGDVHVYAGATDDAMAYFREALALAWHMRDRKNGARALAKLADVEQTAGDFAAAKQHVENGLRLFEACEDQPGIAQTAMQLGRLHWVLGDFEQAIRCYRLSEHVYHKLRNDRGIGEVLHAMGAVHFDQGDIATAEAYYNQAMEKRMAANDRRGLARTLNNIGIIWLERDLKRAVDMWTKALDVAKETGDLGLEATVADNLGEACVLLGRFDDAEAHLARAVHVAERTGRKRTLVDALRNLGLLRAALSQWDGAEQALIDAKRHADKLGVARLSALVERAMGDLSVAQMEATGIVSDTAGARPLSRAEMSYRRAADGFEKAGYDLEAATSHERLADMLELEGRHDEAGERRRRATGLRSRYAQTPQASAAQQQSGVSSQ